VHDVISCASCGAENPERNKFCGDCGSTLAVGCSSCGAPNPPDKKFCGECGAPLDTTAFAPDQAPPRAIQSAPMAERRLVSVLFADLVGFTAASEDRDSEETRELLSRYFDTCRRVIELY
jgi:ribosomal protein L40E